MGRRTSPLVRLLALVGSVGTVGLAFAAVAAATDPLAPRALLDGRSIPLSEVAAHHCHDRAYPVITCFRSRDERDADILLPGGWPSELVGALAEPYVTPYVEWFADRNRPLGSASFIAYISEPDLGRYGWNDRISSFTALNGGHPRWWQHISNAGTGWDWGAGVSIDYVGDSANDQFSSVERLPY